MGQYKIEITAVCMMRDFVQRLINAGQGYSIAATFRHWPGEPGEVVAHLVPNERGFVEVYRGPGDFHQKQGAIAAMTSPPSDPVAEPQK